MILIQQVPPLLPLQEPLLLPELPLQLQELLLPANDCKDPNNLIALFLILLTHSSTILSEY